MARRRGNAGTVYVGIHGHVLALDPATGTELWRTKLEGVRARTSSFVNVLLDGEQVYASFSGEVFCLDARTGALRWQNQLRGLGTGLVTMASATAVPAAPPVPVFEAQRQRTSSQQSAGAV